MITTESRPIYVPFLKWKAGEQRALRDVTHVRKRKIMPLIEITPIPWDFDNGCLSKTIDAHLSKFGEKLATAWGISNPVMLDLALLNDIPMNSGTHALTWCLQDAHAHNSVVIPVTGLGRNAAYQNAIQQALLTYSNGVGIRVKRNDFRGVSTGIPTLLSQLGATPAMADIIIDCEGIDENDVDTFEAAVESVLNRITNINQYRRVILSATSFPATLAAVTGNTVGVIDRSEWILWNRLNANPELPEIIFGDYTIDDSELPDQIDPRILMSMVVGNVRYTHTDCWFVSRGARIRAHGYGQYQQLAQRITSHPLSIFCGHQFSAGDEMIFQCANGTGSTGNLTTWVQAGVNHHISFVVDQLSTPIASSGTP